jgi:putative phage-type endonuclease
MPRIIELEQNTEEWKSFRKNRLGASEAAIVLGISPYTTPFTLWQRKLGLIPEQETTSAMQRGKTLESEALVYINVNTYGKYEPAVVESEKNPFMCASLDGLCVTPDKTYACEIKCLNLNDHDNEYVPAHYIPQLQHQMYCCDLQEITYVGYHPNSQKPLYTILVPRDEEFLADYIVKAKAFWDCVTSFTAPALTEKDYRDFTKNAQYAALDAAYVDIDEKLKGLEKQKDEIRKLMEAMSEGNNIVGPYTKMTHYPIQGKIDYKKAVNENLPELALERYRGKPSKATRITKV